MARAKKAPRELKSKYGISIQPQAVQVMHETIADKINASHNTLTETVIDKVSRLSRLKQESDEAIQAHRKRVEDMVLAACKAAVPAHINIGDRYVDNKGKVATINENTISHQFYNYNQEPRKVRDAKIYGIGSYDTDIYEIDYYFNVMGNTLFAACDGDKTSSESEGEYVQRRIEKFTNGLKALTVENLDNAGMVKTDKPEGWHFPYKRNVKSWLRKMGFNARNDSHDISYESCGSDDDSPCRTVTVIGPRKGSDDLREYAKFAQNCAKLSAYLEKRKFLRRQEDSEQGRGTMARSVVKYHLELIP